MRRVVPIVAVLLVAALAPLASIGPAGAPSITVRLAPGAAGPIEASGASAARRRTATTGTTRRIRTILSNSRERT